MRYATTIGFGFRLRVTSNCVRFATICYRAGPQLVSALIHYASLVPIYKIAWPNLLATRNLCHPQNPI